MALIGEKNQKFPDPKIKRHDVNALQTIQIKLLQSSKFVLILKL